MLGKLSVIGTPIGNIQDITLRALTVLDQVEVLVCEDTRVTGSLINKYLELGLLKHKPKYFRLNEFNEASVYPRVVEMISKGQTVGLVSDAGMPTLSDPGYKLVREVLDRGLPIEIIPGVTALTTALPLSGIGGEVLFYGGFLPKSRGKAENVLQAGLDIGKRLGYGRMVLYVSPHRLEKELQMVARILGDMHAVIIRELTKVHEERREGKLSELIAGLAKKVKGEIVLVVELKSVNDHSLKPA